MADKYYAQVQELPFEHMRVRSQYGPTERVPTEKKRRFEDRDEYVAFLKGSNTALLIQAFVRDICEKEGEKCVEISLLVLIETFIGGFAVNNYATFRFYVFYVEPERASERISFLNEQRLDSMVITDANLRYDEFVGAICARFALPVYANRQLNYYSKYNHQGIFDAKKWLWTRFEPQPLPPVEPDDATHQVVVYCTPKVWPNETIHHVFLTNHGPFPLILADSTLSRRAVMLELIRFLGLDPEICAFLTVSVWYKNHNAATGKRVQIEFKARTKHTD